MQFGRLNPRLIGALLGVFLLLALFHSPAPIYAAGFMRFVGPHGVDKFAGFCLLKIDPCRTIGFALGLALPGGTLRALSGNYAEHLTIDKDITIMGSGMPETSIDGGGSARVIFVQKGATVTVSHLSILAGALTRGGGAGIKNEGTLTLDHVHMFFNHTYSSKTDPNGGAVWNDWTLTVKSSIIDFNTANQGGGIYNTGKLVLRSSKVDDNQALGSGGALANENGGTGVLTDDTLTSNSADMSGGVFNYFAGKVTLKRVTLTNNSATSLGGGLYNADTALLNDITIDNNTAGSGAGVANFGSVTLSRVTFDSNLASGHGGGFDGLEGYATLTNVTFYNNQAGLGAGIFNAEDFSTTALNNVTLFSDSVVGDGIYNLAGGTVTLKNTIVGDGSTFACVGTIKSLGHNLGDRGCGLHPAKHDHIGVHPKVGAFGNWGGYTNTYPLLSTSPAIDAGTNKGCPSTDQRGVGRPLDGDYDTSKVRDIGAYEYQPSNHNED